MDYLFYVGISFIFAGSVHSMECNQTNLLNVEREMKYLTSPGYPEPYDHNLRCLHVLVAPPGEQIELEFETVHTEEGFDKIRIYDGEDERTQKLMEVLEGISTTTKRFISSLGRLVVMFKSDGDHKVLFTGFKAQYRLVLLPKVKVVSHIRGCLAENSITSEVLNSDSIPRKTVFSVLFPPSSFATALNIIIEGVAYNSEIQEKARVMRTYNTSDISRISVTNGGSTRDIFKFMEIGIELKPGHKVVFELSYIELLERRLGRYSEIMMLPRSLLIGDVDYEIVICGRAPITFIQVPDLRQTGGLSYYEQQERMDQKDFFAPYVTVERDGPIATILASQRSLRRTEPLALNKDEFLIHYDVQRNASGLITAFDGEYFGNFYAPQMPILIRRMVFLLDLSGSMAGTKIDQVKIAMDDILKRLTDMDYFNICEMESVVRKWHDSGLLQATTENIKSAQNYIQQLQPDGGTNIKAGLVTALTLLQQGVKSESVLRRIDVNPYRDFIVFLGDGKPTIGEKAPANILDTVNTINQRGYGIYAIGFGKDVDAHFLDELTRENNGKWKHILETERAHIEIQNFLVEIGVPVMTDVKFSYLSNQVKETTSLHHPVLLSDGEVAVFGKFNTKQIGKQMKMFVSGRTSTLYNKGFSFEIPENAVMCGGMGEGSFTEKMFALTIVLNNLRELEQNPTPERKKELKRETTKIAVKYGFLTRLTTLVLKKPTSEPVDIFESQKDAKEDTTEAPTELPDGSIPVIIQGDPHFGIPLNKKIMLCFTWAGSSGTIYNLLSDPVLKFDINGLIQATPIVCDKNDREKKAGKIIKRTYFVKLGLIFEKEDKYIEVTPHNFSIQSLKSSGEFVKHYDATDEGFFFVIGGLSFHVCNVTLVHSLLKITYMNKLTFVFNLRRLRNSKTQGDLAYVIDHLDMDLLGEKYMFGNHQHFKGIFANFMRGQRAPDEDRRKAAIVHKGEMAFLHFKNRKYPVTLQKIVDPNQKERRTCWHTTEAKVILSTNEQSYKVNSLLHNSNQHKNKQEIT